MPYKEFTYITRFENNGGRNRPGFPKLPPGQRTQGEGETHSLLVEHHDQKNSTTMPDASKVIGGKPPKQGRANYLMTSDPVIREKRGDGQNPMQVDP